MSSSAPVQRKEETGLIDEKTVSCDICLDVIYNPLNVVPCNHKFCAHCIRQWHDSHRSCPRCRVRMEQVSRDNFVQEILDVYLKSHPDRRRSEAARREADRLELHFREKNRDRWRRHRHAYPLVDEDDWLGNLRAFEAAMEAELLLQGQQNMIVMGNGERRAGEIRVNGRVVRREGGRLEMNNEGIRFNRNGNRVEMNNERVRINGELIQAPNRQAGRVFAPIVQEEQEGWEQPRVVQNRREARPIPARVVNLYETSSSEADTPLRSRLPPRRDTPAAAPPERRVFRDTSARRRHAERQQQGSDRPVPYRQPGRR